jgi:hypothetical protein
MLRKIVVQLEVLQMRFYCNKAGWVRGICCYVAGVMIDYHGFEYEIRNYKLNDNTTAFIFYKETQYLSILNSHLL